MFKSHLVAACALLAAAFAVSAHAAPAHATAVALTTDASQAGYGAWNPFNVSDMEALDSGTAWIDSANTSSAGYGSALSFTFTVAAGQVGTLSVVDAGFAGDMYRVTNLGSVIGVTSTVASATYPSVTDVGTDFGAAFANPVFSQGVYTLGAGTYSISGELAQSVSAADGSNLNATVGAVSLTVAAIPEPSTYALVFAGLGVVALLTRRRF